MAWPGSVADDLMSPASFYDDGASIKDRLPSKLASNPNPITNAWTSNVHNSKSSDPPSTYDGSYFDDGADMLPRRAPGPGFGAINYQFYDESRAKRREKKATADHPAVQRAASGDINRTMRDINQTRGLKVPDCYIAETKPWGCEKKGDEEMRESEGEDTKMKKGEPIQVWAFPGWSDFIIHSNDGSGRVIVVTDDGEFDSGPTPQQNFDPRAVFEAGLKESQQGQALRAKKKVKQVNFEGYERSEVGAMGDTSNAVPPPASPLAKQERKEKYREEKAKEKNAAQKESEQDIYDLQGAWMSGGRSGWPQSELDQPSKSMPEGTWGRQHTLPTPQETWMSGGLSGWSSQEKLASLPVGNTTFEKRHSKAVSVLSSPTLSLTLLDACASTLGRPLSPASSEDSWEADMEEIHKADKRSSNYHSPTVEDAAETPINKPRYRNGYDDDINTYLNARRGDVRYREDPQQGGGWQ
jgi:hypothetical protein